MPAVYEEVKAKEQRILETVKVRRSNTDELGNGRKADTQNRKCKGKPEESVLLGGRPRNSGPLVSKKVLEDADIYVKR